MTPETLLAGYAGLLSAAFIAATILPAQSELLLAAMLVSGRFETETLIIVATAGNVLGSHVNWGLGRYFAHYRGFRWFPASPAAMDRAERWFARFGPAVLLLSWVPIIRRPTNRGGRGTTDAVRAVSRHRNDRQGGSLSVPCRRGDGLDCLM